MLASTHTRPHASTGSVCRVRECALRRRSTPLHSAAKYGQAALLEALLAHGADVHAKTNGNKYGDNRCGGRSLFWATVGVHRTAVADRDGIDATQIGMHTHAHR